MSSVVLITPWVSNGANTFGLDSPPAVRFR